MSIVSGKFVYFYMARDNLCFLTLVEQDYPKRMAFLYLEEVAEVILQELIQEFGNEVRQSCIMCLLYYDDDS
jgi:vesicle transport protein SEC22